MSFKLTFFVILLISSLANAQSNSNTVTCSISPDYLVKSQTGRDLRSGVLYQNGAPISPLIKIEPTNGVGTADLIIGRSGANLTENDHYRFAIKATVRRNYSELDVQGVLLEKNAAGDYEVLASSDQSRDSESTEGDYSSNILQVQLTLRNPKLDINVVRKDEDVFSKAMGSLLNQRNNYLSEVRVDCSILK